MLQNFYSWMNYSSRKLTHYGLLGIALMLCGLLLVLFDVSFTQKKLELMQNELIKLTENKNALLRQKNIIKAPMLANGGFQLTKRSDLPNELEFIFEAAKANTVSIDSAEYKLSELPSIQSRSYEVNIPIVGSYPNIRHFIDQVVHKNNGVVLSNVELSRDNNQIRDLDGLLQFIIYMKNQE